MKHIKTKSNQTNFSQQEIQFLNNFSSIDDLYTFSTAIDNMVGKIENLRTSNPELFYSLAGGLSGAGVGAVGNLLIGDKKKSKLRRMLEGGLLGGGLAAGAGYLYGGKERAIGERNSLKNLTEEQKVATAIAGNRIHELSGRTKEQEAENKRLRQELHNAEYLNNLYRGKDLTTEQKVATAIAGNRISELSDTIARQKGIIERKNAEIKGFDSDYNKLWKDYEYIFGLLKNAGIDPKPPHQRGE